MRNRLMLRVAIGLCLIPTLPACVQKMGKEGHPLPMDASGLPATSELRGPPEGTVSQESAPRLTARPRLTRERLQRGRDQYGVFCLPCHGVSGHGDGVIVQRGFLAPPSYHQERLRQASDQHFVDVIGQGYGAMYGYGDRVTLEDRWAITAYIRALQLSQNSRISELPREDRAKLEAER